MPDPEIRQRILVDNPAALYRFDASAPSPGTQPQETT
jgi:hypothetical protein